MPSGLARYGFSENPFSPAAALNPLSAAGDLERFVKTDGFTVLDDLDQHLAGAALHQGPLFFLVSGRDKSGRSSVANYLMARYCHYNSILPANFIVPGRRVDSHDKFAIFKKWLTGLLIDLKKLKSFPEDLKKDFLEGLGSADLITMGPVFHDLVARSSELLARMDPELPFGFACCLEKVPTFEIISAAMEIFEDVKTMCIFTVGDYDNLQKDVIWPFRQSPNIAAQCFVELSQLSGNDVSVLVHERWSHVSQKPNPFDLAGIASAFRKPRTIAQVLFLVAELLRFKIEQHHVGPEWPDDEVLAFSAADLPRLVRYAADRAGEI